MTRSTTKPRGGISPDVRTERPTTVAECAEILRGSDSTVLFRGAGTKLDWAGRVDDPAMVLDTTELRGILTHNPADMTASVRAGTTLSELQEHLAGDGQWLALDPASGPAGATVGGLLSAGDSGPSRLRYGALRDLVIGVTLVLADGTVARSGGHVIKNVAGYDLAKLAHGSLGSLALVAEVVVRLHPRPAASLTTGGEADASAATRAALALAASPLEPTAVEWLSDGESGRLLVRLDGTESYVEAAAKRVDAELSAHGVTTTPLDTADSHQAWHELSSAVTGSDDETVLRVSGLPADLGSLVAHARRVATGSGLECHVASSAALGLHTVRLHGGPPEAHAQAFTALREQAHAQGAATLLRSRPDGVDELVDALGPAPSSVHLLRQVKAQFDPSGRCAPGRMRPWY